MRAPLPGTARPLGASTPEKEERSRWAAGRGTRLGPQSRAGRGGGAAAGGRTGRAPPQRDRAAGEARRAPGQRTHQGGRAGSGRPHSGDRVERSPPPRPRPRWQARRDGPAASLPPQLSPSYKYRLGPHPSPPTPGALRKVRRPRAGQREREGDSAAQTAPAPAVRQLPQLEAWPPATPASALPPPPPLPSRSLPSGPRRGPTPARGSCAAAELPGPGPPLQSRWRRRRAGADFGTRRGRG